MMTEVGIGAIGGYFRRVCPCITGVENVCGSAHMNDCVGVGCRGDIR